MGTYEQGLKRLKKDNGGSSLAQPMDSIRSNDSSNKMSDPMKRKVEIERLAKDKFAGGNIIPISVRYKKLGNDAVSREQQDQHRKYRFQQTVRDRAPPPFDMGPKRIKVRGPSYLSLEGPPGFASKW